MAAHVVCRYRSSSATCVLDENEPLPFIPELPWGHTGTYECCGSGKGTIHWQKDPEIRTQIVPSNSRPIPQPRVWRSPGRPMPPLSDNPDCDININCDSTLNNTPLSNTPWIENGEYLFYDEADCCRWRNSRVFGSKLKKAPSRPIKHWRKQLFPRQSLTDMGELISTDLGQGPYANRGRRGSISSTMDTPGNAITINTTLNPGLASSTGSLQTTSCIPIYIPRSAPLTGCDLKRDELACLASLARARPGKNIAANSYSFQSARGYLQARVKLYYQRSLVQFDLSSNLPVQGWQQVRNYPFADGYPLNTVSLYLRYVKNCFDSVDCSCAVPVAFKPSNPVFAANGAVHAGLNIKRHQHAAITRNQYNATNKWGIDGFDTLKDWPLQQYRTRGYRRYSGFSGAGALNGVCWSKELLKNCDRHDYGPYAR